MITTGRDESNECEFFPFSICLCIGVGYLFNRELPIRIKMIRQLNCCVEWNLFELEFCRPWMLHLSTELNIIWVDLHWSICICRGHEFRANVCVRLICHKFVDHGFENTSSISPYRKKQTESLVRKWINFCALSHSISSLTDQQRHSCEIGSWAENYFRERKPKIRQNELTQWHRFNQTEIRSEHLFESCKAFFLADQSIEFAGLQ